MHILGEGGREREKTEPTIPSSCSQQFREKRKRGRSGAPRVASKKGGGEICDFNCRRTSQASERKGRGEGRKGRRGNFELNAIRPVIINNFRKRKRKEKGEGTTNRERKKRGTGSSQ